MTITKTLNGPECILAVEGWLDAESAPNLRAVVETLDEVSDLTLDFSRLLYISSAGLRVLMIAHRVVGEGGKIRVIHAKDVIRTVLEMTGFAAVLTIEDD